MAVLKAAALLSVGVALCAQNPFFSLSEVRPGLRGIGKTVFSGDRIEEFGVEILGVLENSGPKQSIVLARLTGEKIEASGVLQGMSGSPVYVDGRLLGAVALAFPFSKEPLAGIRPIGEMLRAAETPPAPGTVRVSYRDGDLARVFAPARDYLAGNTRLVDIATPLSFGGFTRRTIEEFAPRLRNLGLAAAQGVSGGGALEPDRLGDIKALKPGSMISVQLVAGDLSMGADGTVTHIDGTNIYAFGHQFLSVGTTELPFARAEVLTLAPNLHSSFKISAAREWMGTITSDLNPGIAGKLGHRAEMIPVSIVVQAPAEGGASRSASYRMRIVNDRFLAPLLLQMSMYSALDATERTLGAATASMRGEVEFTDGTSPLRLDDMYAGDTNLPMLVSFGAAVPLGYVLQGGFEALRVKSVSITVDVRDRKREWRIDQVWPSRRTVRPGEDLELTVMLLGENGVENTQQVTYRVPVGIRPGTLNITVADGTSTNLATSLPLLGMRMRSPSQLVALLNTLRSSNSAYVRIWRQETSYRVQGRDLPAPPASVMLVLGGKPGSPGAEPSFESQVAEFRLGAGDAVVSGYRTVQVEVAE